MDQERKADSTKGSGNAGKKKKKSQSKSASSKKTNKKSESKSVSSNTGIEWNIAGPSILLAKLFQLAIAFIPSKSLAK